MALEGWDHVPRGYGAVFALDDAPWWLRRWFRTPFLDRYAHPVAVRRGYGFLVPHPGFPEADREAPGPGWHVRSRDHVPPGADLPLHPASQPLTAAAEPSAALPDRRRTRRSRRR